jgi:hypothetical protein
MRIRFTSDPKLPRDWAHFPYRAGFEVDLPPDQAERWIRRNCAEEVREQAPELAPVAEPVKVGADTLEDVAPSAPTSSPVVRPYRSWP